MGELSSAVQIATEALKDVVSHHGDFKHACEHMRVNVSETDADRSYWEHQGNVLDRMRDQASDAITAWNTRPRTEGRGEEPVAWRYRWNDRRYEDSWDYITNKQRSTFKHLQGDAAVQWEIQPLYASPIREPEISRTILGDPCTLEACPTGLFVADAYNTLGMKTEYHTDKGAVEAYIVESGEFFWGDNPQTVERQRAQIVRPISYADAILNLAPVGGRGEEGSSRADLSPASRSPDQNSAGGEG